MKYSKNELKIPTQNSDSLFHAFKFVLRSFCIIEINKFLFTMYTLLISVFNFVFNFVFSYVFSIVFSFVFICTAHCKSVL